MRGHVSKQLNNIGKMWNKDVIDSEEMYFPVTGHQGMHCPATGHQGRYCPVTGHKGMYCPVTGHQ
jgi:hypothetical protein